MRVDVARKYVLHSEARDEISRLQAEVDRLKRDSYSKEWAELRFAASRNDALEEAAALFPLGSRDGAMIQEAIRSLKRPTS